MAIENLTVRIGANISEFERKMSQMEGKMEGLGKGLQNAGKNLTAKVTAPILALGAGIVTVGADFDSSMSKVSAISGATGDELGQLESTAREMGATTRYSASESADALGYMALAGWDTNQMISSLPGVLNLATAGELELATASDILTDTMSMFGIEADDASRATDVFARAQADSNTSVEQLSEALNNAGPAASAAGNSIEDTSSILGVMANQGLKGSAAGTALNAMYRDLQASAEDGAIAIGDTSVAVYDAEGNMRDMADIVRDVEDATADMTSEQRDAALSQIFQQQSLRGVNMLLNEGTDSLFDLKDGLENSSGSAKEMADIMDDNVGGSLANLWSAIQEVALSFWELIEGPFRSVVDSLTGVVRWFGELGSGIQSAIVVVSAIAAAIGPFLLGLGSVISIGAKLLPILAKGASALGFLLNPITWVVAGIAALGGAFALAYNQSETFRNFINGIGDMFVSAWESVKSFTSRVIEGFQSLWDFFRGDGLSMVEMLSSIGLSPETIVTIQTSLENIRAGFRLLRVRVGNILSEIGEVFSNIWNGIKEWWDSNSESIISPITNAFDTAREWIGNALTAIGDFFSNVFSGIREWWNSNGEGIIDGVVSAFEWMSETIGLVMDLIGSYVEFGWNNLQTIFEVGGSVLSSAWDFLWSRVQTTVDIYWPMIQGVVQFGIDFITGLFNTFAPIVTGIWNTLWPAISLTLSNIWETMKTVVQVGADFIQTVIKVATSIIDGDWSGAWEHIKQFTSDTFENIRGLFSSLRDRSVEIIGNLVGQAKDWFLDMWNNLTSRATDIKNDVVNYITGLKDDAIQRVTEMFNSVTGWFSDLWSDTTQSAKDIYNDVTGSFTDMKDGAIDRSKEMWDGVSGWFSDTWSDATGSASDLYTDVTSSFSNTKDDTIDSAREMWSGVTDFFGDIWDDANELFDNMVDGAKELPSRIGDAIKNMASFAVDGVKSMGNSMAGGLQNVVDGVTGGLNDILDAIGVGNLIPSISIPTFSTGTNTSHGQGRAGAGGNYATFSTGTLNGRIAQDMQGILNDVGPGNGTNGAVQEVIERGGKLLAPQGRDALVDLKKGDRIYNGAETQSMMSAGLIPRFSRGSGTEGGDSGSEGGLWSSLKDIVSNVWSFISSPGEAFSALMDSVIPDFDFLDGFAGKMVTGAWDLLTGGIKDFITNIFKENEGALGSGSKVGFMNFPMTTPYSPNSPVPGYPRSFNNGHHYGIDYGTPIGTPVHAPMGGQLSSLMNAGGGLIAKLVTGELKQFFMHMSSVQPSGSVGQGDLIGRTGNSGLWTTGPHIHWQAQQGSDVLNRNTVNPLDVIGYANGGIITGNPHIAAFNEEGPEAVIPLSSSKRGRANNLYNSVGKAIGRDDDDKETINLLTEQNALLKKIYNKKTDIHMDGGKVGGILDEINAVNSFVQLF